MQNTGGRIGALACAGTTNNSQLSPDTGGGTGGTGNWKLTTHNFQTIDFRL